MASPEPVRLVRMSDEHLAATCRWLQDSRKLRDQLDCPTPPTVEGNADYWRNKWRETSREDYAILSASGEHVGNCGLAGIDRQRRKAELWMYLGTSYSRGRGLGSSALRQLIALGFRELGLNRIWLRVLSNNPGAERFYASNGFVVEGRLRQDTIYNDTGIDSILLSILANEFDG